MEQFHKNIRSCCPDKLMEQCHESIGKSADKTEHTMLVSRKVNGTIPITLYMHSPVQKG
jgi:hypothetical protein